MSNIISGDFIKNEFDVVFNNTDAVRKMSREYFLANYPSILFRYISNGNPSEDTKASYVSNIDQYLEWCKTVGMDPFKINEQHILYYRGMLINRNLKHQTIKFKLTVIRRFYHVAAKYDLIGANPVEDIHAQRDPDAYLPTLKYLTVEQLDKLLSSFDETSIQDLRTKTIIYLMAIEGLRTIEIHRMNVEDINFNQSIIYVRGKGHNGMIYPCEATMKYLNAYLSLREATRYSITPVFCSHSNRQKAERLSRRRIRSCIDDALARCGLKTTANSCHMLRHTCGTLLYAETRDLQVVKNVLRHRNIEMTSRYSHIQDAMLKRYTSAIPIHLYNDNKK